ncbi:MAG: STAS domain-containing protein [Anaerolineales bacterium]|jgi:anti-sigma B factor antagonist|nr:STAS domain-containing protein [Anaerolineae bacterium]
MEIEVKQLKRASLVKVSGRVDSSNAPDLEKALKELMEQGQFRIVVDMSGLNFISSAGLRVLISAAKTCRRWNRGDVYLAALPQHIMETFELAGLTRVFKIFPDTVEAVGNL